MTKSDYKVLYHLMQHGGVWRGPSDGWVVFSAYVMTIIFERLTRWGWMAKTIEDGKTVYKITKKGREKYKTDPNYGTVPAPTKRKKKKL